MKNKLEIFSRFINLKITLTTNYLDLIWFLNYNFQTKFLYCKFDQFRNIIGKMFGFVVLNSHENMKKKIYFLHAYV